MKHPHDLKFRVGPRRSAASAALLGLAMALILALSGRSTALAQMPRVESGPSVSIGKTAPDFVLTDPQGKVHKLSELRGHSVALLFLCGCTACTDLAGEWSKVQKVQLDVQKSNAATGKTSGASSSKDEKHVGKTKTPRATPRTTQVQPITVLVFSGDAPAATDFARRVGLDSTQALILADPLLAVTIEEYNVDPCPRVFVLDSRGIVRYTNNHDDDAPQKAAGAVIAGRAFATLHSIADSHPQTSEQVSAGK